MRIEVTKVVYEGKISMADTINIFDEGQREITFKRGQIHALIEALRLIEFRGEGASTSV